jgi:hypothetical protein
MASRISSRLTRAGGVAAVMTAVLFAAPRAFADPSPADRETARTMMTEGRELRDKGDMKAALQRFKTADSIMHVPTTGLEVAKSQIALGLLLEARDTIAGIRKDPQSPNDPQPFNDARAKAEDLDSQVEGKIPSLTITVGGAADGESPVVSIDGASIPPSVIGLPRKVNPGHHTITAKGQAGEATQEVDVSEGEKKQVQLVLASGEPTPQPNDQSAAPKETTSPDNRSHSPTTLTYVTGGVGAAGLLFGAITGVLSLSDASTVKGECPGKVCTTSKAQSDLSSANMMATLSDVGFIAGIVGAGVAVATLIIGHDSGPAETPSRTPTETGPSNGGQAPDATPAPESRLRVTPWIGFGSAGLSGTF